MNFVAYMLMLCYKLFKSLFFAARKSYFDWKLDCWNRLLISCYDCSRSEVMFCSVGSPVNSV